MIISKRNNQKIYFFIPCMVLIVLSLYNTTLGTHETKVIYSRALATDTEHASTSRSPRAPQSPPSSSSTTTQEEVTPSNSLKEKKTLQSSIWNTIQYIIQSVIELFQWLLQRFDEKAARLGQHFCKKLAIWKIESLTFSKNRNGEEELTTSRGYVNVVQNIQDLRVPGDINLFQKKDKLLKNLNGKELLCVIASARFNTCRISLKKKKLSAFRYGSSKNKIEEIIYLHENDNKYYHVYQENSPPSGRNRMEKKIINLLNAYGASNTKRAIYRGCFSNLELNDQSKDDLEMDYILNFSKFPQDQENKKVEKQQDKDDEVEKQQDKDENKEMEKQKDKEEKENKNENTIIDRLKLLGKGTMKQVENVFKPSCDWEIIDIALDNEKYYNNS